MTPTRMFSLVMAILAVLAGSAAVTSAAERGTSQTPKAQQETGRFKFIRSVQVTPDTSFLTGSFARINYVPATDRFVVTFGTKASTEKGVAKGAGYAYKEYTTDMQETSEAGTFTWNPEASEANDSGSTMVGNDYYFVHVPTDTPGFFGWRMTKYDAVDWTSLAETYIPLVDLYERSNDPMVAYVNGQFDISSQYDSTGLPPPLEEGTATHHRFFSTDLDSLGMKILDNTPHVCGSSMIYVNGIYHFITANAFLGDLVVMQYDWEWNYLGVKSLVQEAHWSQGVIFDGERFYVSYLDTSQRAAPMSLPVYLNVHLAAFDRDWNLVDDVAVTNFTPSDNKQPGRPWVILHNNRLYVSYDCDTVDPATGEEQTRWQAYVSIYELWSPVNPDKGTIGTEMTILESGFGIEKGKALVGTAVLKVLDWKDDSIRCLLTKALPPDSYDVTIQPRAKGSSPIIIEHGFTVKAPEIGPLDPTSGSTGDEITINGLFFGTKKGKLTLGGKSCKVLSWTMVPRTGLSEIRFVVPKGLSPGTHELKVTTTKVGSDTVNFTVE